MEFINIGIAIILFCLLLEFRRVHDVLITHWSEESRITSDYHLAWKYEREKREAEVTELRQLINFAQTLSEKLENKQSN